MNQRIVAGYPPLFEEIAAAFPLARKASVIFSWGDIIYSPSGVNVSLPLQAHEAIHGARQLAHGVERWWQDYIDKVDFRIAEELPAHLAEYRRYCEVTKDRNQHGRELWRIAGKFASPLYGNMISVSKARQLILAKCQLEMF